MTGGRAATPDEPFDLSAVNHSEELLDGLSARRLGDAGATCAESDDPAIGLLAALVSDVDHGAPPLPSPARLGCGGQSSRRRGVRAVVVLGVAAAVLTSAGAAAAGGNVGGGIEPRRGSADKTLTEQSTENVRRLTPSRSDRRAVRPASPRPPVADAHRHESEERRDLAVPLAVHSPPAPPQHRDHGPIRGTSGGTSHSHGWDHHPGRRGPSAPPSPSPWSPSSPTPSPSPR